MFIRLIRVILFPILLWLWAVSFLLSPISYIITGDGMMLANFFDKELSTYDVKDFKFTPLDIKTTSLEFKTRQKQKLINYSINFEPSYNQINNI